MEEGRRSSVDPKGRWPGRDGGRETGAPRAKGRRGVDASSVARRDVVAVALAGVAAMTPSVAQVLLLATALDDIEKRCRTDGGQGERPETGKDGKERGGHLRPERPAWWPRPTVAPTGPKRADPSGDALLGQLARRPLSAHWGAKTGNGPAANLFRLAARLSGPV